MPPELSAIIAAAAKRAQGRVTMPLFLEEMLASPFVRDTLVPWFGIDPPVEARPGMHPGHLAETLWNGQILVNDRYGQAGYPKSGRGLPEVLAHEFAHAAAQQPRNAIDSTMGEFRREIPRFLDPELLARKIPVSFDNHEEYRAYAVEEAMRHIRAGARRKEEVPLDVRQRIPGFDLMFDWLQDRARQTDIERRTIKAPTSSGRAPVRIKP